MDAGTNSTNASNGRQMHVALVQLPVTQRLPTSASSRIALTTPSWVHQLKSTPIVLQVPTRTNPTKLNQKSWIQRLSINFMSTDTSFFGCSCPNTVIPFRQQAQIELNPHTHIGHPVFITILSPSRKPQRNIFQRQHREGGSHMQKQQAARMIHIVQSDYNLKGRCCSKQCCSYYETSKAESIVTLKPKP